jgi:hypothetical protein
MASPEYDSPFPGDNDIKRLAQMALDAAQAINDPGRTPDEVGIDHVD